MAHHPSVVELARCRMALQAFAPSQYAHMAAYHSAEHRLKRWTETRKRRGGKLETIDRVERERLTPGWVRMEKVRRAHDWLADEFRGECFIPDELWDALTLSADEIDGKQLERARRRIAA